MTREEWFKRAEKEFYRFARSVNTLTCELFRFHCANIKFPLPSHPNHWGTLFKIASKNYRWIQRSQTYIKATDKRSHGCQIPVWRSLVS